MTKSKPVVEPEPPVDDSPKSVFDLFHRIVDKLPLHEQEKSDLHDDIDTVAPDDDDTPVEETEVPDNGNTN